MPPLIPNPSTLTAPLRKGVKKESIFDRANAHERIKQLICKESIRDYFNCNKKCTTEVDADPYGIGCAFLQDSRA